VIKRIIAVGMSAVATLSLATAPATLHNVSLSSTTFNPDKGEAVTLRFSIPKPSAVTVKVFDTDHFLVRVIANGTQLKAGAHAMRWNGRDDAGLVVPNEAYFFTIEAKDGTGSVAVYDPVTFSGGEFADITQGQVSRASGTISYQLSQPSRVLLRAGLRGSALFKTIVDWEPRPAGAVTEYWNGRDEDNLLDLLERRHTLVLSYMTLPASSVITYGNTRQTWRQYRAARPNAPRKPERPMANERQISPHFLKSRLTDRTFRVRLSFPELERVAPQPLPVVKGRAMVRVDVDPADLAVLGDQQFEVILFVDTVFHAEEERGYVPLNFPLEVTQLPPGEHVITANIVTLGDQIGVGSRRIRVAK
jgi:FlgD Ig-like domain